MIGPEADEIGRRLAIHLRQNSFEACRDILHRIETEHRRQQKAGLKPTAIAELRLDLRTVNALESAGYVYIRDLDGIDILNLSIPQLGRVSKERIRIALEELAKQEAAEELRQHVQEVSNAVDEVFGPEPILTDGSE